jgi:AmmeMemoRadiSam system protein A
MLEKIATTPAEQQILLNLARGSINYGLLHKDRIKVELEKYPPHLTKLASCFVTLQKNQQLRGCIGTLIPRSPLVQEVVDSAWSAAFLDHRFPKVTKEEEPYLKIDISILTTPLAIYFNSEQDLLSQLRPGIDGLIFRSGGSSGTFLPSVWEQLPNPKDFLNHLKNKAGLHQDYWSNQIEIFRYETEMFGEV